MPKKCYINSDVILDFNSLLFSILKRHNPEVDLSSLEIQENPLKLVNLQQINEYLSVVKPQIGAIESRRKLSILVNFLKSQNIEVILYSDIQINVPGFIVEQFTQPSEDSLIIDPRYGFCENLQKQNYQVILFKNHKLKDKQYWEQILQGKQLNFVECWESFPWKSMGFEGKPEFSVEQFKVNEVPNAATPFWNTHIKLNPIEISSQVMHGKNRGGTMLGIPTGTQMFQVANLQVNEEILKLTEALLPGVYIGKVILDGVQYKSVLSIGYNPYFLDVPLSIEVHLYHDFTEDFYGSQLKLIITHFLRPESDFRSFGILFNQLDHLIKAISNDKIMGHLIIT